MLLGDQLDALLPEHVLVGLHVLAARIGQRLLDLVPELSIELADAFALALLLPERTLVHVHRPLDDVQAPLAEELVVTLAQSVVHVRQRQRSTRLVVVVEHEDVVVRVTAGPVNVRHDERVTVREQLFGELVAEVVDVLHGLTLSRVELLLGEALHDRA